MLDEQDTAPSKSPATPVYDSGSEKSSSEFIPASATNGGREISRKVLYVGGLHKSVSEEGIIDLFSPCGQVHSVKILNDKNKPGFNYAFVEFKNEPDAETALQKLNGVSLNESELKINYAYQSATFNTSQNSEEPTFNIFVGDLSPEVDDEALHNFFAVYSTLKQAHVMWDMQTSRSRGYGFVTFGSSADAEMALQTMNGKILNGRAIRCNWASHKQANTRNNGMRQNNQRGYRSQYPRGYNDGNMGMNMGMSMGMNTPRTEPPVFVPEDSHYSLPQRPPVEGQQPMLPNVIPTNGPVITPQSYDIVLRQTPSWQTTVYLGNIAHFTQQNDLIPLLQNFGFIVDFKFHPEKGCAFVKYDTHERAALAIVQLAGFGVNGRPLKCGWGKSRPPMGVPYQNFPINGPMPMYPRKQ